MTRKALMLERGLVACLLVATALFDSTAVARSPRDVSIVGGQWTWASGSEHVAGWESFGAYGAKGVAAPGNFPGARESSVSWKDPDGNLWLFGGWGISAWVPIFGGGDLNDLWKWDGTSWTWVSGSNGYDQSGIYGTKGIAAPGNVPGARSQSVSWTDASGSLWLFGGYGEASGGASGYLNDLWKWDGSSWTWVSGSSLADQVGTYGTKGVPAPENVPGARYGSVSWTDASGNFWLFGGLGFAATSTQVLLNDLWKWDGTAWTWVSGSSSSGQFGVYGTKGVAAPGNVPGARYESASWTDASGSFWLFGGRGFAASTAGDLNDLWKWDGTTWTWMSGSTWPDQSGSYGTKGVADLGNAPGARTKSMPWVDASGNLWLFGGYSMGVSDDGYFSDLWRWDGTSWTWMSGPRVANEPGTYETKGVPSAGSVPGARRGAISWSDASGNLWLLGGLGLAARWDEGCSNDIWRWDGTNWAWMGGPNPASRYGVYGTKGVAAPGNVPGARQMSVSWKGASGDLWLFGGKGYATDGLSWLNDLWKWNGTSWTWMSGSDVISQPATYGTKGVAASANVPGARAGSVSWTDASGNLWLFGGEGVDFSDDGLLNDLWRWDGTNWTWMSGSNLRNQVGTYGTKGVAAPANVPGARQHAVSWTDASGNAWVFGGLGYAASTQGYLNDLWKWDGTSWTWVGGSNAANVVGVYGSKGVPEPGNGPGSRFRSVSWRDASGRLWLFGGYGYAAESEWGYLNDLWNWDGTNWTWVSGSDTTNQLGTYGTKGLAEPANVLGARESSIAWSDASGRLWLFGGEGEAATTYGNGVLNDLWMWDGTSWTWVSGASSRDQSGTYGTKGVAGSTNVPGARSRSVAWLDENGFLRLFGGIGVDSGGLLGYMNDLWTFPPDCADAAPPTAGNGGPYGVGATIALTASTIEGATYLWTGPNGFTSTDQSPTIPNATLAMAGDYSVTVIVGGCTSDAGTTTVVVLPSQALTVTKIGSGAGSVQSNPAGIDCGSACSASFAGMTQVTLTATADALSRFAGWTGEGCTGTGTCLVTMDGGKSVTATFLPAGGVGFHAVTPCRIVDTRNATGPYGGPALSAGAARAFTIAGQCGVPADASAVALNVTITNPTSSGSLTVYPGTGAVPGTSTISFAAGKTRANNTTIGLVDGVLSTFDAQETGTTHFIVDVSGYFR